MNCPSSRWVLRRDRNLVAKVKLIKLTKLRTRLGPKSVSCFGGSFYVLYELECTHFLETGQLSVIFFWFRFSLICFAGILEASGSGNFKDYSDQSPKLPSAMALSSIKLSTSMMRPFAFSFSRQNCNLLATSSGPIIAPSCTQKAHHYLTTNRQSLTCSGHMRTLSRPITNDSKQQQDSVIYDNKDINNNNSLTSEATLLAKSSERDSDSSSDDPSRPTEGHLQIIADKMADHVCNFCFVFKHKTNL